MPRIRSLKPEFATSLDTGALPLHLAAHLPRLWMYADDEGRGVDDPKLIKAAIWPLADDVTPTLIDGWQAELDQLGRIERYVGPDGRRYFSIPKFRVHQHPKRFVSSKLPAPPSELLGEPMQGTCGEQGGTNGEHAGPVVVVGEGVFYKTPSVTTQVEASLKGVPESSSSGLEPSSVLEKLWRNWPSGRKGTQAEVRRRWAEIISEDSAVEDVANGFDAWLAFWRADETPQRFIPKLSNWLRDRGWTETPPATRELAGLATATGLPSTETALSLYLSGRAGDHPFVAAVAAQCQWDPLRAPQQASWDFKGRYEAAVYDEAAALLDTGR